MHFTESDQQLLEAIALEAAKVIRNTWLYEQLRLRARWFETLVSVVRPSIRRSTSMMPQGDYARGGAAYGRSNVFAPFAG